MNARTARAAASSEVPANQSSRFGPAGGGVHPRRQDRAERQRPVDVVQVVGRAPVVREQQQPEPDLRDEQRLREREQVATSRPAPRFRQ